MDDWLVGRCCVWCSALDDPDGSRRRAALELAEMKDMMNLADEVKCEQLLTKMKSTKMNNNEQLT